MSIWGVIDIVWNHIVRFRKWPMMQLCVQFTNPHPWTKKIKIHMFMTYILQIMHKNTSETAVSEIDQNCTQLNILIFWKKRAALLLIFAMFLGGQSKLIVKSFRFSKDLALIQANLTHPFKPKDSSSLLPWKLTCPLEHSGWKTSFLLKWSLFRGHVSFRGCKAPFF